MNKMSKQATLRLPETDTNDVKFALGASLGSILINLADETGGHARSGLVRSVFGPGFQGEASWYRLANPERAREVPSLIVTVHALNVARDEWYMRVAANGHAGWTGQMSRLIPSCFPAFYGQGLYFNIVDFADRMNQFARGVNSFRTALSKMPTTNLHVQASAARVAKSHIAARNEYSPSTSQGRKFLSIMAKFDRAIKGTNRNGSPFKGTFGNGYAANVEIVPGLTLDAWLLPTGWGGDNRAKGSSLQVDLRLEDHHLYPLSYAIDSAIPMDWRAHTAGKYQSFSPYRYDEYLGDFSRALDKLADQINQVVAEFQAKQERPKPYKPKDLPGPFDDDDDESRMAAKIARAALDVGTFEYDGPHIRFRDHAGAALHAWRSSEPEAEVMVEDHSPNGYEVLYKDGDGWIFKNDTFRTIAHALTSENQAVQAAIAFMRHLTETPNLYKQLPTFRRAADLNATTINS